MWPGTVLLLAAHLSRMWPLRCSSFQSGEGDGVGRVSVWGKEVGGQVSIAKERRRGASAVV